MCMPQELMIRQTQKLLTRVKCDPAHCIQAGVRPQVALLSMDINRAQIFLSGDLELSFALWSLVIHTLAKMVLSIVPQT